MVQLLKPHCEPQTSMDAAKPTTHENNKSDELAKPISSLTKC